MLEPDKMARQDEEPPKLQTGMTVSDTPAQTGLGEPDGLTAGRNTDVAGMVSDYLKQDSALMVQGRTQGRQEAAQRGLLNSSMAAGASTDAMARQAVPIASQQANINTNANQRAFDRRENRYLQDDQQGFQGEQAGLDRDLQRDLQTQDQDFRATESDLARQQELRVQDIGNRFQRSQAEFEAEVRTNLQQMDQAFQTQFQNDEQGFQQRQRVRAQNFEREMQTLNLSEQQRQQVGTMANNASGNYQNTVVNILGNTEMNASGRTKALNDARSTYEAEMAIIEDLFRVELNYA